MKQQPTRYDPARRRTQHLARFYGLTVDDYEAMRTAQEFGCAICGIKEWEIGGPLQVDHNHDTGAVRGLLCPRCNKAIGAFRDDPSLLQAAAAYLIDMAALKAGTGHYVTEWPERVVRVADGMIAGIYP